MSSGAGTRVGRYEIVAEIGRGGMGIVYEARDPRIDRTVALKTISLGAEESAAEKEYRERFVLEAQAVGRLSHPGIVTIFDAGEDPETKEPYIAMEYVQGQSLHMILAQRDTPIPLDEAMQIAQEIAEALEYAHSHGVVHRDIKPANILMTADGHAKVADFGIAKLAQAQMTLPGEVLGSPAYMAPEQLRGDGVDPRSDLFSAGVILYNMLTGFRPFQGDSATTICYKVVNRNPIFVSAFDASFPPELDRIVAKAIAKTPEDRFQSGREMADAIAAFRKEHASKQNPDFLKEVIEEHNLVPVFREFAAQAGVATPAPRKPEKSKFSFSFSRENAWMWVGIAAMALILLAAPVLAIIWSTRNSGVPAIVLSQTIPAPKIEVAAAAPAAIPVAASPALAVKPGTALLDIQIQHDFSSGKFWLWLDHKLICEQDLHNEAKRHALFFKKLEADSIELTVPSGEHWVEVKVESDSVHYDQTITMIKSFDRTKQNVMHVDCDKDKNLLNVTI